MNRLDQIKNMLAADPDDVFLNFSLAMELAKQNRTAEAVAQFNKVIDLDPGYSAAYQQQAKLLIATAQKDKAQEILTQGITAAQQKNDTHAADDMQKTLDALKAN